MDIDPQTLPPRDRYKLLIGCIVPRPIAWVSTVSPAGVRNLAPFSFFNGVGSNPMTIIICPANNSAGQEKDTLRNCKPRGEGGTGQFVICGASEHLAREMAATSADLPPDQSEWELVDLEPTPSAKVAPPRVARSPWAFECETLSVVRTNPGAPAGGNVVIGQVVHVHLDDAIVNDRLHIDPASLRAIGRMGGLGYCTTRQRFEMPMGPGALELDPAALGLGE